MKKYLYKVIVLIFFVSQNVCSQTIGENYIYNHDTLITKDKSIYQVENLGANINSSHAESGPKISPDGKNLYFFKVVHDQNIGGSQDIWQSTYVPSDSSWTKATHVQKPLNSYGQDAVHWISKDGNTMLLHNEYYKNGTVGNGVSITHKVDGKWSFPKALKIKGYRNNQVCSFFMNDDKDALLMCVQQKDKHTYGLQDIYVSERKGLSLIKWGKPKNLGPILNTAGKEATVWLNHTQDTIYFSSNGHKNSIGGMDVYRSFRTDTSNWTSWSKPVNLGVPYNTKDDEYYFSIPDKGDYIYMAHHFENLKSDTLAHSDIVRIRIKDLFIEPFLQVTGRFFDDFSKDTIPGVINFSVSNTGKSVFLDTTFTNQDVFSARLAGQEKYKYLGKSTLEGYLQEGGIIDITDLVKGIKDKTLNIYLKRKPGLKLSGFLFDDETKNKIPGNLTITIAGTNQVYKTVVSDSLKGYDVFLEPGKKYEFKYKSNGYFNKIQTIDLSNLKEYKEEKKDVYLTPFKEGQSFVINNIFFELDKAILKPQSFIELDNLVEVMKEYKSIVVEIQGHTDSQGSDEHNNSLSQRRAQSVVNYLSKNGISASQFVARGYGEKSPRATNDTEEGKQINRRVEFKILKIIK